MQTLSDKELVSRVVATKDINAFEVLLRRHQKRVTSWLRQLDPHGGADDIAQEAFISAWNKIHTFRGDGEFKSWLMKIAYTSFLQFKRKQKSQDNLLKQIETLDIKQGQYSDNQVLPDLQTLLDILSLEEKACMVLCYSFGYSHSEISAMLNLPLGSVKSHIRRSTQKIRIHFDIEV